MKKKESDGNILTRDIDIKTISNKIKCFSHDHMSLLIRLSIAAALILRIAGTFYSGSVDYTCFLVPWTNAYSKISFSEALRTKVTNYYVPYNIILILISRFHIPPYTGISIVSCSADAGIAYFVYKIYRLFYTPQTLPPEDHTAEDHTANKKLILTAAVSMLLPVMFLDSAWWKQCDSIYTLFSVMCIYYFLQDRYITAFLLYGAALSFKLQAIFLLPFLGISWLIRRNHSFFCFFLIPAVYIAAGLPSVIAGMDLYSVYGTYMMQAGTGTRLFISYPNLYSFIMFLNDKEYARLYSSDIPVFIAETVTAFIILFSCVFIFIFKNKIKKSEYIAIAGWYVWTCCMFLPCMHERYDFTAVIFIFIYAFCINKRFILISIVINIIDAVNYLPHIFMSMTGFSETLLSIINMLFYIKFSVMLIKTFQSGTDVKIVKAKKEC